jgi:acetyltransferase-like isoleucine patch superfamily enzyme
MKIISNLSRKFIHYSGNIFRQLKIIYLRIAGVKIGKNSMISLRAKIDVRRGEIVIGDNCHITYGCVILSHDGSARQLNKNDDGEGKVIIGNNVFIGVSSIILRNVKIGDNSIIGAGSVVTKDIPPRVIAMGNPAKVVGKIETSQNDNLSK